MEEEEEEEEEEVDGSLGDLRLSDSEMSSFRRDDKGRISITKKSEFLSSGCILSDPVYVL